MPTKKTNEALCGIVMPDMTHIKYPPGLGGQTERVPKILSFGLDRFGGAGQMGSSFWEAQVLRQEKNGSLRPEKEKTHLDQGEAQAGGEVPFALILPRVAYP